MLLFGIVTVIFTACSSSKNVYIDKSYKKKVIESTVNWQNSSSIHFVRTIVRSKYDFSPIPPLTEKKKRDYLKGFKKKVDGFKIKALKNIENELKSRDIKISKLDKEYNGLSLIITPYKYHLHNHIGFYVKLIDLKKKKKVFSSEVKLPFRVYMTPIKYSDEKLASKLSEIIIEDLEKNSLIEKKKD